MGKISNFLEKNIIKGIKIKHIGRNLEKIYHQLANYKSINLKEGANPQKAMDMVITFQRTGQRCNDMDKMLKPLAKEFKIGKYSGTQYEMGAEGKGIVSYCIKDSNGKNIFMVERYYLSESWGNIANEPDFIKTPQQVELFNKVMENLILN